MHDSRVIVSSIQNPCSALHKEANDKQLKNPKSLHWITDGIGSRDQIVVLQLAWTRISWSNKLIVQIFVLTYNKEKQECAPWSFRSILRAPSHGFLGILVSVGFGHMLKKLVWSRALIEHMTSTKATTSKNLKLTYSGICQRWCLDVPALRG